MAERIDPVVVDVRDGPGTAHLQIAIHEHHANRIAGLQRTFERHLACPQTGGAAARGDEALAAKRGTEEVPDLRLEARHHERCRDGAQQRAQFPARQPGHGICPAQLGALRTLCKGPVPVERPAKRGRQVFARQREVDLNLCAGRPHAGHRDGVRHFRDGSDPGNGLFGKRTQRVRHGADEPPVDVHGAAAHAGDDTGVGQRPAFEARENQIAARADHVLEHAQDIDLELFDAGTLEYRPADRDHTGKDFIHVHLRGNRRAGRAW